MGTVREVLKVPDVRRIELGWALTVVGEIAGTVALVVYAFGEGGAALVAAYAVTGTTAAIGIGFLLAAIGDRVHRDRLLRILAGLRAGLMVSAALVAALSGPAVLVVALGSASFAFAGTYRPLQAAILPWLVRTPAELTASNVASGIAENTGALVGPALAGALVALAGAPAAIAMSAGFFVLARLALRRLALPPSLTVPPRHRLRVFREVAAGISAFIRLPPPGGIAMLLIAQTLLRGALTVLIAVLAVDVLALGEAAVGWLTAAIGVGGLVGGFIAAAVVRITRLGRTFVVGLLLWGLPMVALSVFPSPVVAYLALMLVGIGNAIEDAAGFTMIARLAPPKLVGRVLAATELLALTGIALGSLIAPLLIATIEVGGTLAALGGAVAVLALANLMRFRRLDAAMPAPGPELELVRGLPMFANLSLAVSELVAGELRPHRYEPGAVVVHEGDAGDEFHLVLAGSAAVTVHGRPRPPLGRGDCFGEIALLRDVPRTATITATQTLQTLALGRTEFLTAISGNPLSAAAADAVVTERLAADPPVTDRAQDL